MSAGLPERKLIELRNKLGSIEAEFQRWRADSEAGQPLEKHHRQIRRVTGELTDLSKEIGRRLDPDKLGDDVLAACRELELAVLSLHRVWEFFRGKLALRYLPWFRDYLAAADDFAYACYRPAQDAVDPSHVAPKAIKEPPLVFLNGGSSPFAMTRRSAYAPEAVPGEEVTAAVVGPVLRALPIPVVGVPWYQVQHLPDLLVIGHEIGHAVEDDLRLTESIQDLLDQAMERGKVEPARRPAWRSWLGEVFADLYGTLATGPAYVGTLIDFLADSRNRVVTQRRTHPAWGLYPTDTLRVQLNVRALAFLGMATPAAELLATWTGEYATHAMKEFEGDIDCVVDGLLDGPYQRLGGRPLSGVLGFSPDDHQKATQWAERLNGRWALRADDLRPLLAAARLAFALEPGSYDASLQAEVLEQVKGLRSPGTRRGGAEAPDDEDDIDAMATGAGARLLELISDVLTGQPDQRADQEGPGRRAATKVETAPTGTSQSTRSQGLSLFASLVAGALILVYLLLLLLLWSDDAAAELSWARRSELLKGVEALAFAAAGAILGTTVQRQVTKKAEEEATVQRGRADAMERDAEKGRALHNLTAVMASGQSPAPGLRGARPSQDAPDDGYRQLLELAERYDADSR